jgi:hypothetical protein
MRFRFSIELETKQIEKTIIFQELNSSLDQK